MFLNRRRSFNKDLLLKVFKKEKKRLPKSFTHDLSVDFKYLIMYPVQKTASVCWIYITLSCKNCTYKEECVINNSFKFHNTSDLERKTMKDIIRDFIYFIDPIWYDCKSYDKNIDIVDVMKL